MPGYVGDYFAGLIMLFILSALFVPVGSTIVGALRNPQEAPLDDQAESPADIRIALADSVCFESPPDDEVSGGGIWRRERLEIRHISARVTLLAHRRRYSEFISSTWPERARVR